MSCIEANISVKIPDGVDIEQQISAIQAAITKVNGLPTYINVIEVDDPLSTSSINIGKRMEI